MKDAEGPDEYVHATGRTKPESKPQRR